MKKLFSTALLLSLSTVAFADWRMDMLDMDENGFVTPEELKAAGCSVRPGLFLAADKDKDGQLSQKEVRKASAYIVRRHCPKNV